MKFDWSIRVLSTVVLFILSLCCDHVAAVIVRKNSIFASDRTEDTCGYQSCSLGKPGLLNVHIVAHTHNDVGWLKTVDQYYYGSRNDIQFAGVQYILDSVIAALNADPARKFIYVETAFFWRWWQEQPENVQKNVQDLVNQGRLTFINGAWSMNDEATTHYSSLIENYAWGLRRLQDAFGKCGRPTVGWQIDPFGHSRGHATLLAQLGFDGLFLGRVDYQDKLARQTNKSMEMIWQSSPNLKTGADLFTGILPNGYSPPLKFCFDALCRDDPIMDDRKLTGYNVEEKVQLFMNEMTHQSTTYLSNNLIVTMGEDFNYQNAEMWFKNLDKLIKYVNDQQTNGSKINLLYSTPACYLYALNQANLTWPVKSDDFFPYGPGPHSYWTGYFTSRPAIKLFERKASAFLSTCKQISAMAQLTAQEDSIASLREAVGVAQHHDAISLKLSRRRGTAKQEVAFDYALQLDQGIKSCQEVTKNGLKKMGNIPPAVDVQYCDLLNISQCAVMENNKKVTLLLWNPLARIVQKYIHIPVPNGDYSVSDVKGTQVRFQINPLFQNVLDVPGRQSSATQELVFYVTLPAIDYGEFTIERVPSSNMQKTVVKKPSDFGADVTFQNEFISVTFDQASGLMKSVTNVQTQDVLNINQIFYYYTGITGNNSLDDDTQRASGAYIFRPNCTSPGGNFSERNSVNCKLPLLGNGSYTILQGSEVQEIRQYFAPWISQIIRLYTESELIEFDWQIGPIPVDDSIGKEIVTLYSSDMKSDQTFFTDINGREMAKRIRNVQPSYKMNLTEPISSNYYPVNTRIYLQNPINGTQLTILTDRTQGGTSLEDGQLELMLHRRLLVDDGLGVGEALNETSYGTGLVVRGKHYLLFSKMKDAAKSHRLRAQDVYWPPESAFIIANTNSQSDEWFISQNKRKQKPASSELPVNIHLLSFEQWTNASLIIRLEHLFEKNEDPTLSQPVTVDLQTIIGVKSKIKSITELTIDGNVPLSSINRLSWRDTGEKTPATKKRVDFTSTGDYNVTMNCMEIRTFQIQLDP